MPAHERLLLDDVEEARARLVGASGHRRFPSYFILIRTVW
jgi:hypothetical protein